MLCMPARQNAACRNFAYKIASVSVSCISIEKYLFYTGYHISTHDFFFSEIWILNKLAILLFIHDNAYK